MTTKPVAFADDTVLSVIPQEMMRVDALRMKLNMDHPYNVLQEFVMRRALLRSRHALHQRDRVEALRMWKVLVQFGHGPT